MPEIRIQQIQAGSRVPFVPGLTQNGGVICDNPDGECACGATHSLGEWTAIYVLDQNINNGQPKQTDAPLVGLDLEYLLTGDPCRLIRARRYSTSFVVYEESTAEHTYFTLLYTWVICRWVTLHQMIGENGSSGPSLHKALTKALFHDFEEAITGDCPRNFKHANAEFTAAWKQAAGKALMDLLEPIAANCNTVDHAGDLMDPARHAWAHAKDNTMEGRIVKLSDFLSVVSYMGRESRHANESLAVHYGTMDDYLAEFDGLEFDFLRPIINEARRIVERILRKVKEQ